MESRTHLLLFYYTQLFEGDITINENMNSELVLQYIRDNHIIDIACVQKQIEMTKREKILKQHKYRVWRTSKGKWKTYLPTDDGGRVLRERSTQADLEDIIIQFYKGSDKPLIFDDVYHGWRKIQDQLVSDNTIAKYNSDYIRFFKSTDFSIQPISELNEEDVKVFLCKTIQQQELCKRTTKSLFGYINNVFNSAVINHYIIENPMGHLIPKSFYKYTTESIKPMDKRIVSDIDMKLLYDKFYDDYRKHSSYIPTYAVELASLTGMRVGELSALKWDCITDSFIIINKSEKYNKLTKEFFIDKTKNGKERIFPLTDDIKNLLDRVKKAEIKNGYVCDWVFANEEGRIHAPVISSCCKNKCRQVGITEKGIHAYRRTVNSKMRCEGVSATVAASLLGHTEEVNENYYTFDVSTLEQKTTIVSQVNSEMKVKK